MMEVNRSRQKFELMSKGRNSAHFWHEVDPPGEGPHAIPRVTRFSLERELFEDMGEPEVVTLTVEPGDLLNEGDEDD